MVHVSFVHYYIADCLFQVDSVAMMRLANNGELLSVGSLALYQVARPLVTQPRHHVRLGHLIQVLHNFMGLSVCQQQQCLLTCSPATRTTQPLAQCCTHSHSLIQSATQSFVHESTVAATHIARNSLSH